MRKVLLGLGLCLLASSAGLGQWGGVSEFGFKGFLGFSLAQTKGVSQYGDIWNGKIESNIEEYADINYKADNGIAFGGALSYMFTPNFGLELGGALFSQNVPNDTSAQWAFSSAGTDYGEQYEFSGEGKLTTLPIFINLVGRFSRGLMDFNISGGPALYLNTAEATATGLYGDHLWWLTVYWWGTETTELIDFFPLAMEIPSTRWTGFGFNAGGSVDFNVSPTMALFLEIRYFFSPPKNLSWRYIPGIYDGKRGKLPDWDIYPFQADYAGEITTPYKANPSFFLFSAGIKIRFGGGGSPL
jgi:opacity protein-like surface antigen